MSGKKHKSLLFKCVIGICIGILVGLAVSILLVLLDIYIPPNTLLIIWIIVILSVGIFFIAKLASPLRYVLKGQIDTAINIYLKQIEKYGQYKSVYNANNYNIATCYNLKGDFEDSIEYLKKINETKLDKNLTSAYYFLFASDLILLERDIGLAEEYLLKSRETKILPGLVLLESCIETQKGNFTRAKELIMEYKNNKKNIVALGLNIMFTVKKLENITNDFLIGLNYLKMNDLQKAKQSFEDVSKYEYDFYYVRKAKELLQGLTVLPTIGL